MGHRLSLGLAMLATACGATRYEHALHRSLAATQGLACSGYLVWNHEPVRDVFLVINGSGILSNAFVHPTFAGLVGMRPVAYSTYDKPGVEAPFGDPAAVRRDDATLERYTLGDGVACAVRALRWAREQFGPAVRLHLRGHSEGTLVALYAYDALLEDDPEVARNIATLVLSGLALESFEDILERQLTSMPADQGKRLRAAVASCDWAVLRNNLGVSCAYLADASHRPSGRVMFERLDARAAPARFFVFQGQQDQNTPAEPVHALEAWNEEQGHLRLEVHFYEGGHAGTEVARGALAQLLWDIVASVPEWR